MALLDAGTVDDRSRGVMNEQQRPGQPGYAIDGVAGVPADHHHAMLACTLLRCLRACMPFRCPTLFLTKQCVCLLLS